MAFQINSAGLVTTGTTGSDLFSIEAAAGQKTTVLGLAGNDTINAGGGLATATALVINAAGGADVLSITGATTIISASTIMGGAGADTINLDISGFNASQFKGGDGNDVVTFSAAGAGTYSASTLNLGGGADSLTTSGAGSFALNDASIQAGAGDDTITLDDVLTLRSAQIIGGGGADQITISAVAQATTGMSINADSSANGGGADTITIINAVDDATIKGKGGKDVLTINGVNGTGSQVLGNAGADVLTISGSVAGSANLIGAGAGNDTIQISAFGGVNSVVAGGGADLITLTGAGAAAGSGSVVMAGAGADTITVYATYSGTNVLGALSDSTLTTLDSYTYDGAVAGTGAAFTLSAVSNATLTTGIAGGNGFAVNTIFSGGLINSGDFETAGGVTARAAVIDAEGGAQGTVFVFQASNDNFLFIQGGAAGTADDYIAKVGSGNSTGLSLALGSASIKL